MECSVRWRLWGPGVGWCGVPKGDGWAKALLPPRRRRLLEFTGGWQNWMLLRNVTDGRYADQLGAAPTVAVRRVP